MNRALRVLNIEDSELDAELLLHHLSKAGYDTVCERVQTSAMMIAALEAQEWDVILCDYSMPGFDALQALTVLGEMKLDVPFIIVSGTVGEENAVEAMRAGANDYLMKDSLARLGPTIERELNEAANRRAGRRVEQSLKDSEAELRALFEAMTDVILVLDSEGRCLKIAPTDPAYVNKPSDNLIGKKLDQVYPKQKTDFFLHHIRRALDEGQMHRVEYSLRTGEKDVWFDASVSPMSKDSVLWIARDITERKEGEERLQQSDRRFRQLADNINEVFWVVDPESDEKLYVSPAFEEIWGRTVKSLYERPKSYLDSVHPEDWERIREAGELHREGIRTEDEYRIVRPDGSIRWIYDRAFPIKGESGSVIRVVGIAEDISERKRVRDALRDSEESYRLLFERNPQPMWVFDLQTLAFLEVNDAVIHHYGYSREEFLAMTIEDIRVAQETPPLMKHRSGATPYHKESGTWKHRKKDGAIIDVEINSHELVYYDRPAQIVLAYDVTERKLLEEQFRHSQKMEAIGQLAGGIAHDFNNLLTAIIGYSELSMNRLRPEDPLMSNLREIKHAGDRAASLTRQLLAFSRKQVLESKVLDLNSVVSDLEKMLRRLIGEDIELFTVLEPGIASIKADPGQIEQIIMNLVVNARDAMHQGGKLMIETRNIVLDEDYARTHLGVTPGDFVMLAVSDSGTGIDADTQLHIFEPFFTTKEVGKGTGLGLSTAYGIVTQSGGSIEVHSELGLGTTFKIYLPGVNEGAQEYKRNPEIEKDYSGTETILVAEDDATVRKLTCEILAGCGYEVLEAANGGAALFICEGRTRPIHLLLTDIVMPEMGGRELAERLRFRLGPDMRVVYMSGYTDNATIHKEVLDSEAHFIQKPFSPTALARRVREVLSEGVTDRQALQR